MNEALLECFIQLITHYTGLNIREQDREVLSKKILARIKALKLSTPSVYYELLAKTAQFHNFSLELPPDELVPLVDETPVTSPGVFPFLRRSLPLMINSLKIDSDSSQGVDKDATTTIQALGGREWKILTSQITTGESYFFRDRGQFTLLRHLILPELIDYQRKVAQAENRSQPELKIWSAGCSTGEEPYSLAILLTTLIPDWQKWNLLVIGTDLNYEAIEKAKQGNYNSWSFRLVDENIKQDFFSHRKDYWHLNPIIRKIVDFKIGNLVSDSLPNPSINLNNIDLILCRNVFVYFDPKATALVLEKFYRTLRPGGYLMTAHAELHGQHLGKFQGKLFPESVIYQRSHDSLQDTNTPSINLLREPKTFSSPPSDRLVYDPTYLPQFPVKPLTVSTKQKPPEITVRGSHSLPVAGTNTNPPQPNEAPFKTLLKESQRLFHHKAYREAIKVAEKILSLPSGHFEAYYLMAQASANLGDYETAKFACQQALMVQPESILPYYVLAHIAEEQGDVERAKLVLKKIIYLAPKSINAYLELGSLYDREGNESRAKKMRTTARHMLKELPPDTPVEPHPNLTARELLFQVEKLLRNSA